MKKHPLDTSLEKWPQGWLVLEVARLSDEPYYLVMSNDERKKAGLPITKQEMQEYIRMKK